LSFLILNAIPSFALLFAIPIVFVAIFLINWPRRKKNVDAPEVKN
jgi:drug/metabolite transporter (DMT)-like permease